MDIGQYVDEPIQPGATNVTGRARSGPCEPGRPDFQPMGSTPRVVAT